MNIQAIEHVSQSAHLLLLNNDKTPQWKGWDKRRAGTRTVLKHIDGNGAIGVIPYSIGMTVADFDSGNPSAAIDQTAPMFTTYSYSVDKEQPAHLWYADHTPRTNLQFNTEHGSGDIRSANGYITLHDPDSFTLIAENLTSQASLFPVNYYLTKGQEKAQTATYHYPCPLRSSPPVEAHSDLASCPRGRRNTTLHANLVRWTKDQQGNPTYTSILTAAAKMNSTIPSPLDHAEVENMAKNISIWIGKNNEDFKKMQRVRQLRRWNPNINCDLIAMTDERNKTIRKMHREGAPVTWLAGTYKLNKRTIQRIIYPR